MKLPTFIPTIPLLTCLGVVLPVHQLHGQAEMRSSPQRGRAEAIDVSLAEGGMLLGLVVNPQGRPLAQAAVTLRQANREVARVVADQEGRFAVTGLRGGTYEIATARTAGVYRLWAAHTAPPAARPGALIVEGDIQVRGQHTMTQFLSRPWVLTAVVAAAVAVPVTIASQKESSSKTPASQ